MRLLLGLTFLHMIHATRNWFSTALLLAGSEWKDRQRSSIHWQRCVVWWLWAMACTAGTPGGDRWVSQSSNYSSLAAWLLTLVSPPFIQIPHIEKVLRSRGQIDAYQRPSSLICIFSDLAIDDSTSSLIQGGSNISYRRTIFTIK